MDIEKLNEFNLLKEDVEKLGNKAKLWIVKMRLAHLIEFLKGPYVWEFTIALLPLNASMKKNFKLFLVNHLKQRTTLKLYDQVESKLVKAKIRSYLK